MRGCTRAENLQDPFGFRRMMCLAETGLPIGSGIRGSRWRGGLQSLATQQVKQSDSQQSGTSLSQELPTLPGLGRVAV